MVACVVRNLDSELFENFDTLLEHMTKGVDLSGEAEYNINKWLAGMPKILVVPMMPTGYHRLSTASPEKKYAIWIVRGWNTPRPCLTQ
jgi:hypothetical protein